MPQFTARIHAHRCPNAYFADNQRARARGQRLFPEFPEAKKASVTNVTLARVTLVLMPKRRTDTAELDALPTVWAHVAHLHRAAARDDEAAILRTLGALWAELAPDELPQCRTWAALTAAPVSAVTPDELRTFAALLAAVWHNFAPLPADELRTKKRPGSARQKFTQVHT